VPHTRALRRHLQQAPPNPPRRRLHSRPPKLRPRRAATSGKYIVKRESLGRGGDGPPSTWPKSLGLGPWGKVAIKELILSAVADPTALETIHSRSTGHGEGQGHPKSRAGPMTSNRSAMRTTSSSSFRGAGKSLRDVLKPGNARASRRRSPSCHGVLQALDYAQTRRAIVHRDMKPENVLMFRMRATSRFAEPSAIARLMDDSGGGLDRDQDGGQRSAHAAVHVA